MEQELDAFISRHCPNFNAFTQSFRIDMASGEDNLGLVGKEFLDGTEFAGLIEVVENKYDGICKIFKPLQDKGPCDFRVGEVRSRCQF